MEARQPLILVIGANGQIGGELVRVLAARPGSRYAVRGLDRPDMDLGAAEAVRETLRALAPDLIINAAGYTAVDRAEAEPQLARRVNAVAPGIMAEEAARAGAAFIHYSTDYVFDGARRTPYRPDDAPSPLSVYGRTKYEGERAIAAAGAAALVLRTSWIHGGRSRNFLDAILRRAESGGDLRVVDDQRGGPTWSRHVAEATASIIDTALVREGGGWSFGGREGTYHFAARGDTTWYGFARSILACAGLLERTRIEPISTAEYGAAAPRPAYSVLDSSRTTIVFGVTPDEWASPLAEVIGERARRVGHSATNPLAGSPMR